MQLGFIGLGTMGRPMALHLLNGGHAMSVYARRAEAARPLVDQGATACPTPATVAERSDVVFIMVTGTSDVEQVVLGDDGVIQGARRDALVVDMSTIDPTATRAIARRLAAEGVAMLDAPVSGGPQGAGDAALTIMVGVVRRRRWNAPDRCSPCLVRPSSIWASRVPVRPPRRVISSRCL